MGISLNLIVEFNKRSDIVALITTGRTFKISKMTWKIFLVGLVLFATVTDACSKGNNRPPPYTSEKNKREAEKVLVGDSFSEKDLKLSVEHQGAERSLSNQETMAGEKAGNDDKTTSKADS